MGVIVLAEKKYYWLKLKNDFFNQPRIKKLRRLAGGDTYTIIYLKMQLLSLENEGVLIFEGIEDDFVEELALTIDEDTENVRFTVMYLINQGLLEEFQKDEYALPEAIKSIGSENASAERKRRSRENRKMLEENRDIVTTSSQLCHGIVTNCHTEIEIEKEIDTDKEIEKEREKGKKAGSRFVPPTLEEVSAFIAENNYRVNAEKFIDYYNANGWMVGKTKMKDWKAAVRNWHRNEREVPKQTGKVQQKFKPEGRDLSFLEV